MGEHNHCRNPVGDSKGVWCYTTDPDKRWEHCPVPKCAPPKLKVLDFSADSDHEPDTNGEYTSATLNAGPIPESFTICSAFMVEAWTTDFESSRIPLLLDRNGRSWGFVTLYAASSHTEYYVRFGPVSFIGKSKKMFFPHQWTRVCTSLNSVASKVMLVVDGQLLGEEEYRREEDTNRPANLSLVLGHDPPSKIEETGRVTELNIFSSALPLEMMKAQTRAEGKDCATPGDLVNWEEAEWTLHSKAKMIEVDREWEGPCRSESQVQVFTADFKHHEDCMQHCQKISKGRSPPVKTRKEWEGLKEEVDLIAQDRSSFPYMWLSATEGDKNGRLTTLDHWPETETVKNATMKMEAVETVWRDFYTGQRLDNWTKPFKNSGQDSLFGDTANCMYSYNIIMTWREWECVSYEMSCPCIYPSQPILRF